MKVRGSDQPLGGGGQQPFQGVFPIKCNPESHLLDQVVDFGFGLEVGSKPELLIALSKLSSRDGALLICNGYKACQTLNYWLYVLFFFCGF